MTVSALLTRANLVAVTGACVLVAAACSSSSSPTSPTPTASGPPVQQTPTPPSTPAPAPTPTPTPPPPAPTPNGAVQITVTPNPSPHNGTPITDAAGCRDVRYTWFYDQVMRETGGSNVTFTSRIDLFDDRETNNVSNLNVVVPANGTTTIRSRWCSLVKDAHTAQTRWSGTDANGRAVVVLGPKVILAAPLP